MKKIILVSAHARHGKDTIAELMRNSLESKGERVLICHYADLLKYICKTFFNWDGVKDDKGRTILQHVGTDVIRERQPDFWVDFIIKILDLFSDEWDYIIIPDTRFPNEIEEMKFHYRKPTSIADKYMEQLQGFKCEMVDTIRINRPNFDSGLSIDQLNHPSECALDNYEFDHYITNDGTIEELEIKIKKLVDKLMNK